jgi:hypothetical protein
MTTIRPRRRVTTDPGLLFNERNELRTFIAKPLPQAGQNLRHVGINATRRRNIPSAMG